MVLCLFLGMFSMEIAGAAENDVPDSLLPEGLMIEEMYRPGFGKSVGNTLLVQGKVVILHTDKAKGYFAKDNLLLYKGDTLITEPKGRIRFQLNDESIMTLGSKTKLVISKSIYDPAKKSRSSFLGMDIGKARFLVTKFIGFRRSEFKVKTKTAVAGVRGSDFIVKVELVSGATENAGAANRILLAFADGESVVVSDAPMFAFEPDSGLQTVTTIINGPDTTTEVISLAAPDLPATVLGDFEQVDVVEGQPVGETEPITPSEFGMGPSL